MEEGKIAMAYQLGATERSQSMYISACVLSANTLAWGRFGSISAPFEPVVLLEFNERSENGRK
jgi:hypothetical protein